MSLQSITLDEYWNLVDRKDSDHQSFMEQPPRDPRVIGEECRGLKATASLIRSLRLVTIPTTEECDELLRSTFVRVGQPKEKLIDWLGEN